MLPLPKLGFLLGKFMPPHEGHRFLCRFARARCEELVILVASMPDEPIPGRLRYEWMKTMFPDCHVVWTDEVLPQEPTGPDDDAFWETWKRVVSDAIQTSGVYAGLVDHPDAVFASEEYGRKLAATVDARFIPCDLIRQTVPVSGTLCRANIREQWHYLPDVVRSHYVQRVCLFGPESSGKSTLARALGDHFKTVVVPEYGRTYTEVFGPQVGEVDLMEIVAGHLASVKAAKMISGPVMIEDTDPIMTAVWSDMLVGARDDYFETFQEHADLYILCDIDIPWVDDGTRYFPEEEDRKRFFDLCKGELLDRNVPFVVVRGTVEERLEVAVEAIDGLFAGRL